jgi:hypothetical protein
MNKCGAGGFEKDVLEAVSIFNLNTILPLGSDSVTVRKIATGIQNTVERVKYFDIFVNCSWVDTRWQWYSTHLHTNT